MSLLFLFACSNISGQWRDYSFNKSSIPAKLCVESDCEQVAGFSLEIAKDSLDGDFRLQIEGAGEQFIYTVPVEAFAVSGKEWSILADTEDYPDLAEQWVCFVRGRILDCEAGDDLYQFRRGGHP
mgnify:CR=1 FL=1